MRKRIVVPLDGSQVDLYLLPYIRRIVNIFRAHTIVFARVIEPFNSIITSTLDISVDLYHQITADQETESENYLNQIPLIFRCDNISIEKKYKRLKGITFVKE
jgi:hypothetical protein